MASLVPIPDKFHALETRGISQATAQKFKVSTDFGENDILYRYPVFRGDEHVCNKVRHKDKKFHWEGDTQGIGLFGQNVFPAGSSKAITITEGQDDAMAAFELQGSKYPTVSVHSSGSAVKDCKTNYEYLDSFDEIVLCFDADEPGRDAAKKVALLFRPGKVRIISLQKYKDANEYLRAKEASTFVKEWWSAPTFTPDGIKIGRDLLSAVLERPNHFTVQYPFEGLNKKTFGIRLSEAVIVTADTGVGKTSFLKHIEHKLLTDPEVIEKDYGVGFLHLEEPIGDTLLGLMSVHNAKPYHLPTTEKSEDELRSTYNELLNNDRVVVWDHFGSNSIDAVLEKVRHMVALGCRYIVIDHLSIIVSDQAGDERKQLDEISTKLKTMCMELDIALICVIHTNRQGQIRGTAGVEQLANIVVRLERDRMAFDEWRRNVMKVSIEKNRFSGMSGPTSWLYYDPETSRLRELNQEEIDLYEQGLSKPEGYDGWADD